MDALCLVVIAGDALSTVALPSQGAVTIGRAEGCEVRIDSHAISRRHARLHLDPPLRIEDLGSSNGTFVRDTRALTETARTHPLVRVSGEAHPIALGERVSLGFVTIVVRRSVPEALRDPGDAIIADPATRAAYAQAERVAASPLSVLLLGETGVGKDVLARALHRSSPRAGRPFLALNCAALPPTLLEGELFGHERGSFTGATQAREGLFEAADGGTVFLDEIGELPLEIQVKLLRVLEDRTVVRIGGRSARRVDLRFVAATNRDLAAEVAKGTFRRDLFFRLAGMTIELPPLRARPLDLAPLAERFAASAARELGRPAAPALPSEVLRLLRRHSWPGNVRELRNVIDRAVVLCDGDRLTPEDLPAQLTTATASDDPEDTLIDATDAAEPGSPAQLQASLKAAEKQRILAALEACAGNQTRAASKLGISLRTLINRLDAYAIPRPRRKARGDHDR